MNKVELERLIAQIVPGGVLDYDTGNWFGVRVAGHWFSVWKRQKDDKKEEYYGRPFDYNRQRKELKSRWEEVKPYVLNREGIKKAR